MGDMGELVIPRTYSITGVMGERGFFKFQVDPGNGSLVVMNEDMTEQEFKSTPEIKKDKEGWTRLRVGEKDKDVRLLGAYKCVENDKMTIVFIQIDDKVMAGYISSVYEEETDIPGLTRKTPVFTEFEPYEPLRGAPIYKIGGELYNIEWVPPKSQKTK